MHGFDEAIAMTPDSDGALTGRTTGAYWNMIGPFGGITAATLLNAVLQHPERLGDPVAITVNFAGPVPEGDFRITVRAVRTNRSTQHWLVEQFVAGEGGDTQLASTATVVTALRRDTWSGSDVPAPQATLPAEGEGMVIKNLNAWLGQYEIVLLRGTLPSEWDGRENADSLTRLWLRDSTPRKIDFCSLVAACDVFYPRVWLKRARMVPAGTVSFTVYLHADQQLLDDTGTEYLLAQAHGQEFRNAFSDQSGQIWNAGGVLLATTHQIMYYKE